MAATTGTWVVLLLDSDGKLKLAKSEDSEVEARKTARYIVESESLKAFVAQIKITFSRSFDTDEPKAGR